ncbi:ATP-binding protein [Dactylosporangium sp. McL0621]|uniref:ATP-binding protein n=1 Tax=Dactylosporangium sp. McL0621 TaxID=3415678 RepID=UPI003CE8B1BF
MSAEKPDAWTDLPVLTSWHPTDPAAASHTALPAVRLHLTLTLRREPASVGQCRRLFDTTLIALNVGADCRDDIALILTEACTNAVVHAAGETYRVNLTVDRRRCVIEVFDHGTALHDTHLNWTAEDCEPLERLGTSGRGMLLIHALSDAVEWFHVQPHGLGVRMSKQLVWDADRRNPAPANPPRSVANAPR